MHKRELLARVMDASGAWRALLDARRFARVPWLTVLTWHRVSPLRPGERFDDGAIDATPEEFDWQVAMLARHCSIVGMDDLYAHLGGKPLPPNPALITFDDGYRDCHDIALPILQKHGARGVFFIATHYVQERRLYWWDRIHLAIKSSSRSRLVLDYPEPIDLPLGTAARPATIHHVLHLVKVHRGLDLPRFLDALEKACDAPLSRERERAYADDLVMTWDHVRAMRAAGMDIESHTRTHRVLGTVATAGELDSELTGSRADLEAALDHPVRAIAYPVGPTVMDSPEVLAALERARYQLGFTNKTGIDTRKTPPRFDVRRLSTDRGTSPAAFRMKLALPQSVPS